VADPQVGEGERDPRQDPIIGDELEDAESHLAIDEVHEAWVGYVRTWRPRPGSKDPLRRAIRGTTLVGWRRLMKEARLIKIAKPGLEPQGGQKP
jgi:hypothetical protein